MLLPGLPMPCMAANAIMVRAHSFPVAERQAPPQPPSDPDASIVFLEAHSRAERPDVPGRDSGLAFCPLGRLGHAVGLAQHVGFPLVEAGGPASDVLLVVGTFGQPGIGDPQTESHVGAQSRREPLVRDKPGGVVVVGVDKDHLDAQFLEPGPAHGALERGVDAAPVLSGSADQNTIISVCLRASSRRSYCSGIPSRWL